MYTEFDKNRLKKSGDYLKSVMIIMISLVIIFTCSIFSGTEIYTVHLGNSLKKLPIYRVGREDKKIAITFDCAWGVDYTDKILDALDKFNVKCTFFAVQFWVEKYPDYVKKIVERGHEIGTHSATHSHMSKLSRDSIIKELKSSTQAIEKITGKKVTLFRAPFGEYNDTLISCATEQNLYTIQWDVDSLDWKEISSNEITERVIKRAKSGSIILCHNNGTHTYRAIEGIMSAMLAKGYTFVPVSQLIYTSDYTINRQGEQRQNNT